MGLDSGGDFSHKLAPIHLQLVGTIFAFSLKMVPTVNFCVRLYTKINLLLISSSKGPYPSITLRF